MTEEYFVLAMPRVEPEDIHDPTEPPAFYIPPIGATVRFNGHNYQVLETVPLHYDPVTELDRDRLHVQFKGLRLT
jgi:hypothetical protein